MPPNTSVDAPAAVPRKFRLLIVMVSPPYPVCLPVEFSLPRYFSTNPTCSTTAFHRLSASGDFMSR
jgi:hypothetical protein